MSAEIIKFSGATLFAWAHQLMLPMLPILLPVYNTFYTTNAFCLHSFAAEYFTAVVDVADYVSNGVGKFHDSSGRNERLCRLRSTFAVLLGSGIFQRHLSLPYQL